MSTRIEGKPVVPPLYIDSANDRVGINEAVPAVTFEVTSPGTSVTALRVRNSTENTLMNVNESASSQGVLIVCNNLGTAFAQLGNTTTFFNATGVAIGATTYDASARLQVDSTTSGFLPPRMTTAQKNSIASPATGLVVYDSTLNKLCVYTGAAWQTVTSA